MIYSAWYGASAKTAFLGNFNNRFPRFYWDFDALFLNSSLGFLPESSTDATRALFLGITLAAYPIGQFIGSPILGGLSDVYGRKKLMWISLVITALSSLLSGFAITYQALGLLIISRFVAGLMEGNIAIARAMAADIKTISKQKSFGKINASASIAYLLGPLIGGLLSEKINFSAPFYLICGLFVLLSGLSALLLKESISSSESGPIWKRFNLFQRVSQLFTNKQLKYFLILSTCFSLAVDIFYEFGPVYLTVKWALNPAKLILYNGVLCIGLAIGNGWLPGFITRRISHRSAIILGIAGFALMLFGMVVIDSTYLMAALFGLTGFGIGLAMTLLTVNISNSGDHSIQGEILGTQQSLRVLGDGVICLFGGALLILSPKIILTAAALIACATLVGFRSKVSTSAADN